MQPSVKPWPRYAKALDLRLAGWPLSAIGDYLGVSKERARQLVVVAEQRLAYRVFGVNPYRWKFDAERGQWTRIYSRQSLKRKSNAEDTDSAVV